MENELQENIDPNDNEKLLSQPEIIESICAGSMMYGRETLVRDANNNLAKVADFNLIEDKTNYGSEDPSIRKPKKQTKAQFTLKYADGTEIIQNEHIPKALYIEDQRLSIPENDPFYEFISIEVRGHEYRLGELISFDNQVGILAIIYPDKRSVAVSAREVFGEQTPSHLYCVNIDQIDYILRDNGAIKKNSDGTVFKPSF